MMAVTQQSNYANQTPYNFITNPAGMFVHSNPPKPLISSSTSLNSSQNTTIRNWVKNGDVEKLENLVLEGQGARLLGLTDSTSDMKVKSFLRGIPGYMAKVDLIHDAVIRGSVRELQTLLDKKKLSLARDAVGRGLAHKAVLHSQRGVLDWLGKKYPESIQIRDNESRSCLHYSALSKNPTEMYNFLLNLGSNPELTDIHGRKASYYLTNPQELYIDGVGNNNPQPFKRNTKSRFQSQRRKISPISPKSSPSPPTISSSSNNNNNNNVSSNSAGALNKSTPLLSSISPFTPASSPITRAQIRIWIHEKDISKLESIVWKGEGKSILLETTNNPKVRRFLDNVPYLLHHIKLIHTAAIHNDVEGLKEIRSRIEKDSTVASPTTGMSSGGPIPIDVSISRELFTARDSYGLSAMHKATGLNNRAAAEYLLYEFPSTLNLQDNFKRTPLHYAAVRTANEQNTKGSIYQFLTRAGADNTVLDYRNKDAPYYLTHPNDCDSFKYLRNIPDAPRVITNPERGLIGWDRSGVTRGGAAGAIGAAAAAALAGSGNKRKISATSGEFDESVVGGGGGGGGLDGIDGQDREGSGGKIARTSDAEEDEEEQQKRFDEDEFLDEEEDEIKDVGDGYVADSDEGKYELNTEDVVVIKSGEVVLEEEEGDQEGGGVVGEEEKSGLGDLETENKDVEVEQEQEPEVNNDDAEAMEVVDDGNGGAVEEAEPPVNESGEKIEVDEEEGQVEATSEPTPNDEEQQPPEEEAPPPPSTEQGEDELEEEKPEEETTEEQTNQDEEEEGAATAPPPDYTTALQSPVPPQDSPTIPPPIAAADSSNNEESVDTYIQNSDMESLVNLVLKGRGHELTGKQTQNPEIQEFLNNVPAYMAKIASIHNSAYTGNMRDLQSLLDRKRLAEAQDSVGRGPLHHAVLGNNPQVIRYLVNGYPQCIDMPDGNGRTALHYSAALPDSGVMYKVLIQAGADPNLKDKLGNTPGIYLRRKDLIRLDELINATSAVAAATNNKSQRRTSNKTAAVVDTWERPETPYPILQPGNDNETTQEQAAFTRTNSISVIKISDSRPSSPTPSNAGSTDDSESDALEVPMQNLSLLNSFYLEVLSKESESIWSRTWKKLTTTNSTDVANKYVRRYLTPKIFHRVKMRSTPRYNSTLLDCIKFYPQFFIVAPDPHAYSSFAEVFMPAIMECNGMSASSLISQHPSMVLQGSTVLQSEFPIVDLPSKFVHQVRVRVSRNIRPFPFVPIIRKDELYEVQKIVKKVYAESEYEWYDLEGLEKHEREELVEDKGIWFPEATKISRFWPKGRGFLSNESGSEQVWCNAEDHVDVVLTSQYGKLHPLMSDVIRVVDKFTDVCEFHFNSQCGYLTVDPFRCGTGIKITFRLRLPNMMQNRSYLTQKCDELKLTLKWKQKYRLFGSSNEIFPDDWIEVENVRTWGCDENEIVLGVIKGVQELIKDEEDKGREIDRATTKKKEHGSEKDGKQK